MVIGAAAAALAHRSLGLRFIPLALDGAALTAWGWHVFKAELYLLWLPSALVLTWRLANPTRK